MHLGTTFFSKLCCMLPVFVRCGGYKTGLDSDPGAVFLGPLSGDA